MLKSMRKNMKFIMWILLITFVLWGGSSAVLSRSKTTNYAGIVFGSKVGWKEYEINFNAVQNQAKMMYGEKFNQIKQYLNLEEDTWNRIALLRYAQKKHINVSDSEVINTVCGISLFQDSSGRFVPDIYKRVMEYFLKTSPREFEEGLKDSLKITKLREQIIKEVSVSDDEIKQAYKTKNEKINADYALINAIEFSPQVNATDEILKQYYLTHKEELKTPLRLNIEYIPFEYDQYKNGITATTEEIDKYYESRKKDYQKELDDAKQKGTPEQDTVTGIKERIKRLLIDKKAQDRADDASSNVSYELAQAKQPNFRDVAKKFNLPVKESGFFAAEESIPGIGLSYAVSFEAFKMELGQVSSPIKGQNARYIIKLKDKKEPYIPTLEEARPKIKDIIIKEEAKILAIKKGEQILSDIKQKIDSGENFKQACSDLKLEVKTTGLFSKQDYIPNIGKSDEFANIAFSQDTGKLAGLAKVPDGAAIIFITERTGIDEEKYKTEKDAFKNTVLEEKQNTSFQEWLKDLKQKADIKVAITEKDRQAPQQQASPASFPMDF